MESLSRGLGEIISMQGEEVIIRDDDAATTFLYTEDKRMSEVMQAALPPQASLILANNQELSDQLQEQGWHLIGACSQYLYTAKEPLPVKYKNIRQLTLDDLEYVNKHYHYEEREYLARRIWAGLMFGAYDGDRLVGFIGWIPYGHVMEGNEASELLQEKMGLYKATKKLYWLDRQQ